MRSILLLPLMAAPAFATGLDVHQLERLLGLGHAATVAPPPLVSPSALGWRLLGTLRARDGGSLAAVEWNAKSVTLQVGDVRDGVEVISIEQQTLIVRRDGRLEVVGARPGVGSAPARAAGRSLSRQVVSSLLANPQALLTDVQLVPAMVGAKLSGFRARYVKEGSLIAGLGLRSGDTIVTVNGLALDNLERVFSLLQALTTTQRFDVELERNGQRVTESVSLER